MSYDEETYKGCTIRLEQDDHPWHPREDSEPAGTMVCWHSRYSLGDGHNYESPSDFILQLAAPFFEAQARLLGIVPEFNGYEELADELKLSDKDLFNQASDWVDRNYVILPLYLYDHGGISISTGKFSCPWDSGQVGYIFMSYEKARSEWPSDKLEESIEKSTRCLKSEVKEYDAYLRGDVVGWITEDEEGETIDSCWGFYPDEDGRHGYAIDEAKHSIDCHLKHKHQLDTELCANI
jgi:hypothetical protein